MKALRYSNFNPRFPWGKRRKVRMVTSARIAFQSTLPVGEATSRPRGWFSPGRISIHASRGGSDDACHPVGEGCRYFNPRFPWGKRPRLTFRVARSISISIHASRGGSDCPPCRTCRRWKKFQSTLPVGEATPRRRRLRRTHIFQSTLPVGEATEEVDRHVWD